MGGTPSLTDPTIEINGVTWWRRADGSMMPDSGVKAADRLQDDVARSLVGQAIALHLQMKDFKQKVREEVTAYVDLLLNEHGAPAGGVKGNMTIRSYDGCAKAIVAVANIQKFGPELQVAKSLVDEFVQARADNIDPELKVLLFGAFDVDQQDKLNHGRLFGLFRYDFKDEVWLRAMNALRDSIIVEGTKEYLRFQIRSHVKAEWETVSLDLASI